MGVEALRGWDTSSAVEPEQEAAAHVAVAEALVGWDDLEQGGCELLAGLARSLSSSAGVLWVPSGERLRPRVFWQDGKSGLRDFKMMTLTSRLRCGVELPGRAWQLLEPSSRDLTNGLLPPRMRAAQAAGIVGVVALPAVWAGQLLAVVELDCTWEPLLSLQLKRSLAAIGAVLGQFLIHRRGELEEPVITARQVEILQLAAEGLSVDEIAARLVVSRSTVKTHLEHAYERLGVSGRVAAVAEAMRRGLVQ
jgi:DNA-binding CsgD family transcriptional regulator